MPWGVMPSTQGNPNRLHENKLLVGVSASINVESEYESTNDTRVGLEVAWLHHKLYLAGELYYMNVGFTERQKIDKKYNFLGGYVQGGYFVAPRLQLAARYDFFNRNGMDTNGFLNMPAVGLNYFFRGCNLNTSSGAATSNCRPCTSLWAAAGTTTSWIATTTTWDWPRIAAPYCCNILSDDEPTV